MCCVYSQATDSYESFFLLRLLYIHFFLCFFNDYVKIFQRDSSIQGDKKYIFLWGKKIKHESFFFENFYFVSSAIKLIDVSSYFIYLKFSHSHILVKEHRLKRNGIYLFISILWHLI